MKTADIQAHADANTRMAVKVKGTSQYVAAYECEVLTTEEPYSRLHGRGYTVRVRVIKGSPNQADGYAGWGLVKDGHEYVVRPQQVICTWAEHLEREGKAEREKAEREERRKVAQTEAAKQEAELIDQFAELRGLLDLDEDWLPTVNRTSFAKAAPSPDNVELDLPDFAALLDGVRKLAERAA